MFRLSPGAPYEGEYPRPGHPCDNEPARPPWPMCVVCGLKYPPGIFEGSPCEHFRKDGSINSEIPAMTGYLNGLRKLRGMRDGKEQ